ncbi:MAG: DUF4062 domain-containing protein [Chloroflexi bacterium]|nr:DUF4062 domain-containing protein [Chloroflexota bacterium]
MKKDNMLRVFVSSTFSDLKDYRQTVCDVIRQLGGIDVAMEHLGARDDRSKDECLRIVREESDAFVGIYAHRYGHVPHGDTESITEMEYDTASLAGLKRLIYIVDDDVPWSKRFIDTGKRLRQLDAFKAQLRAAHIVKPFTNKDQLSAFVVADIAREFAFFVFPRVGPGGAKGQTPQSINEWNDARSAVYHDNRNVFLAHTLQPSSKIGQLYDIAIYLIPHHSSDPEYLRDDLSDVLQAEFFLGAHFGNRVFNVHKKGGTLGIVVSAYGPFLCACRVTFTDGIKVVLYRYIDFEMGRRSLPPTIASRRRPKGPA